MVELSSTPMVTKNERLADYEGRGKKFPDTTVGASVRVRISERKRIRKERKILGRGRGREKES